MGKKVFFITVLILSFLLDGCHNASNPTSQEPPFTTPPFSREVSPATLSPSPPVTETMPPSTTPTPEFVRPSVIGPPPSTRVAAFYYPWYENPAVNRRWSHWESSGSTLFRPPEDISSDYYPVLEAYSSGDSSIIAQHMAWLRQAGVGLIIVSWWGKYSSGEAPIRKILDEADIYGIKVAFHIEPYQGRTARSLPDDISYLYDKYGSHPAFYLTTETSPYCNSPEPKGVFFLWYTGCEYISSVDSVVTGNTNVPIDYWREALDRIHAQPQSGILLAQPQDPRWITESHFDGIYNYGTLNDPVSSRDFDWSWSLPPGAWYVPSVVPGYIDMRTRGIYGQSINRNDGVYYDDQWQAALDTGIEPQLMTITSFNEWHEGTQIEPAASGADNGMGFTYLDYGALGAEGYLELTRQWVTHFEEMNWPAFSADRSTVSTTLGHDDTIDGLRQLRGVGDGPTREDTLGGKECLSMTSNGSPTRYMYFNVNNEFIYARPAEVEVTVEYFNNGTGWFALEYDSSDFSAGPLEGRFKMTPQLRLSNNNTWKTAVFQLTDAYFGDRQHNGVSDFRIVSDQDLAVSSVTVSLE